MSMKGRRFAFQFWGILGFVGGGIAGGGIVLGRGYSVWVSVLCAIGGGAAGAILLAAFMFLHYTLYRMDMFSKDGGS